MYHGDEARLESVREDGWYQDVTAWLLFRGISYNLYRNQIIEPGMGRAPGRQDGHEATACAT